MRVTGNVIAYLGFNPYLDSRKLTVGGNIRHTEKTSWFSGTDNFQLILKGTNDLRDCLSLGKQK